jgi:hypothetical protein
MSLIKQSAVIKRLPASCSKSRKLFMPVDWAKRENLPEAKSDELGTGKLAFDEDFTLEHSIHSLRITATEISGVI